MSKDLRNAKTVPAMPAAFRKIASVTLREVSRSKHELTEVNRKKEVDHEGSRYSIVNGR